MEAYTYPQTPAELRQRMANGRAVFEALRAMPPSRVAALIEHLSEAERPTQAWRLLQIARLIASSRPSCVAILRPMDPERAA